MLHNIFRRQQGYLRSIFCSICNIKIASKVHSNLSYSKFGNKQRQYCCFLNWVQFSSVLFGLKILVNYTGLTGCLIIKSCNIYFFMLVCSLCTPALHYNKSCQVAAKNMQISITRIKIPFRRTSDSMLEQTVQKDYSRIIKYISA